MSRIGIDLDDVIAVCAVPYLRKFAEEFGVELPVHLKPTGDYRPDYPRGRYDAQGSAQYKTRLAQDLRLDAFCEDDDLISRSLAEAGIRVFLFDHPWNRDVEHPLITRVSGWSELADRLAPP